MSNQPETGHVPAGNQPVRVRFGTHSAQTIPLEWAETMLILWRRQSPARFGAMLAKAAGALDSEPQQ